MANLEILLINPAGAQSGKTIIKAGVTQIDASWLGDGRSLSQRIPLLIRN
jgi:hypothetical protein